MPAQRLDFRTGMQASLQTLTTRPAPCRARNRVTLQDIVAGADPDGIVDVVLHSAANGQSAMTAYKRRSPGTRFRRIRRISCLMLRVAA